MAWLFLQYVLNGIAEKSEIEKTRIGTSMDEKERSKGTEMIHPIK